MVFCLQQLLILRKYYWPQDSPQNCGIKTEVECGVGLETSNAWKSVQKSDGVDPPESAGKGAFLGLGAAPWPVGVRLGSDRAFHHQAGDSFMEHTWSPRAGHDSRRRAHSCVVLGKSLDPSERQFLHVRDCRVGRLQAAEILSSCRT